MVAIRIEITGTADIELSNATWGVLVGVDFPSAAHMEIQTPSRLSISKNNEGLIDIYVALNDDGTELKFRVLNLSPGAGLKFSKYPGIGPSVIASEDEGQLDDLILGLD